VTLRELTDGRCRISLRTSAGWVDANKVCALLGGGGHAAAAGATGTRRGGGRQACRS
jgi:phosphoesterase RecJ-like protein